MALNITGVNETGLYGEALTSLYARIEPKYCLCGTKIDFELYYYKDKASYQANSNPIKSGDRYTVTHIPTDESLFDLHGVLITHLVDKGYFTENQLTIVDVPV